MALDPCSRTLSIWTGTIHNSIEPGQYAAIVADGGWFLEFLQECLDCGEAHECEMFVAGGLLHYDWTWPDLLTGHHYRPRGGRAVVEELRRSSTSTRPRTRPS